jgi:hypothetical protein
MDRKDRNAKTILGMLAQADDAVGEAFRVRTFAAGEASRQPRLGLARFLARPRCWEAKGPAPMRWR